LLKALLRYEILNIVVHLAQNQIAEMAQEF
jgi:hypothetical protein